MTDNNSFTVLDYIILCLTLITPMAIGVYFGIVNKKTNEDLLVGGRKLRIFPVAASIMTTWTSAITTLGYPAEVYSYGTQIFQASLVSILFIPMSIYIFVPFFHAMKLTSINEYLEMRFKSLTVRQFAAFIFILQQLFIGGIVLYAPSIALEKFLNLSPWISIAGLGIVGTIYTSIGGLKAVVWTDTFQLVLMYSGILAVLIRGIIVAGGVSNIMQVAGNGGRLNLFDFSVDPLMRHNFLNFFIGFGLVNFFISGIGIHEVQRYSSLPTLDAAKRSLLLSIPIKVIALGLCVFTGLIIYTIHVDCDPLLLGKVKKADELVPLFVVNELTSIPGMLGLFTSSMFCGVLSTYSSAINGLVAVTWKDFLSKLLICQNMKECNQARFSMLLGGLYGVLIAILAFIAKYMGGVLQAANTVQGFPIGILGAVFLLALFVPFANAHGVIGGMIIGLCTTLFISIQPIVKNVIHPTFELTINNCPTNTTQFISLNETRRRLGPDELQGFEKMYTLSYLLYPVFATITTFVTGLTLSLISRAFLKSPRSYVDSIYLHPFLQTRYRKKDAQAQISSVCL